MSLHADKIPVEESEASAVR